MIIPRLPLFFTVLAVFPVTLAVLPPYLVTDFDTIVSEINTLADTINVFPESGGNLNQFFAIDSASQSVVSSLDSAVGDIQGNGWLSEADGQSILTTFQDLLPNITNGLSTLVTKRPLILNSNPTLSDDINDIIRQDVSELRTLAARFANALIALSPDLIPAAQDIAAQVDSACATAYNVYNS